MVPKLAHLLDAASKFELFFGVWFERRKVDKKKPNLNKLTHSNSILESFERLSQIS